MLGRFRVRPGASSSPQEIKTRQKWGQQEAKGRPVSEIKAEGGGGPNGKRKDVGYSPWVGWKVLATEEGASLDSLQLSLHFSRPGSPLN